MYGLTKAVPATEFTRLPEKFRKPGRTAWGDANAVGMVLDSFLEGPSFDRAGNLYVTDIPFGRVFRISPAGEWTLVTEYDGWPNGLKIHKDGRIFITDYKRGIVLLDAASGKVTPLLETRGSESFKGVNDLFFAANGDLYFTDQGQTGLHDPTGRVYRYDTAGKLTMLVNTVPSPNGLVMNKAETVTLFNDMCVFAPRALVDPGIQWREIDPLNVSAAFTNAGITIQAVLTFNAEDELVDFVSDDRLAGSADGKSFTPCAGRPP